MAVRERGAEREFEQSTLEFVLHSYFEKKLVATAKCSDR